MKKLAAVFAGLSLLVMPVSAGMIYDVTADFSIDNGNPNGVWTYGEMALDFSSFTPYFNAEIVYGTCPFWFAETRPPEVWRNDSGGEIYGIPPGCIALHPRSNQAPSVVRWTAPATGEFNVVGQFLDGDIGAMEVGIRHGTEWLWQATGFGVFDLDVSMIQGETLDFAVYDGYWYGNTGLEATITSASTVQCALNCEPSSGVVPFGSQMTVYMKNLYLIQSRQLAARIDVALASGTFYANWRAGSLTMAPGDLVTTGWMQIIPSLGLVIGENVFELIIEDVTPAPWNHPPYFAAGDTSISSCTITGIAP